MKLSDTVSGLHDDLKRIDDNELVSITFTGITWKMKISSLIKIFEYANKYFEEKKAQSQDRLLQ